MITLMLCWVLALIASVLQVFDVISTNKVLAAGGYERNKVVAKVQELLGEYWWLIKLPVVAVFICAAAYQAHWLLVIVLLLVVLVYAWVIKGNYAALKRQQSK